MIQHKNNPLFDYSERVFMLNHCKYIDKFVKDVNYIVSCGTLDRFNCSKYLHSNEILITINGENGIDTNVITNRYITFEKTKGISTTTLLLRLYNYILTYRLINHLDDRSIKILHNWCIFCIPNKIII